MAWGEKDHRFCKRPQGKKRDLNNNKITTNGKKIRTAIALKNARRAGTGGDFPDKEKSKKTEKGLKQGRRKKFGCQGGKKPVPPHGKMGKKRAQTHRRRHNPKLVFVFGGEEG